VQIPNEATPSRAEDLLVKAALFLLGGFVTHIWAKYRARITTLRYNVWHYPLGFSADDPVFGSVKLSYNDTPVKNLFMSTVTLANDSTRDLSEIDLNIVADADSVILVSHGRNQASLNDLQFTDKFSEALRDANQTKNWTAVARRRDYSVPVLNRGDTITFGLLITNPKGAQPHLTVACDEAGVRLRFAFEKPKILGEPQDVSAWLGSAIALLACWPLIKFVPNKTLAVFIAAALGILAMGLGVLARKLVKFVARLLS
jgi:hypothetical protein